MQDLDYVNIRNNRLVFDEILKVVSTNYILDYIPQKEVLEVGRVLSQIGDQVTIDRTVAGGENYSWFKDGTEISQSSDSFIIDITDFDVEGSYVAEVTSSQVASLTLTTAPFNVRISSLRRDSLAVVAIAEATNPDLIATWSGLNVADWPEVTVANQRVTALDFAGSSLTGDLPEDVLDIAGLETATFTDNDLGSIPILTELTNLTQFAVSRSRLDFG